MFCSYGMQLNLLLKTNRVYCVHKVLFLICHIANSIIIILDFITDYV